LEFGKASTRLPAFRARRLVRDTDSGVQLGLVGDGVGEEETTVAEGGGGRAGGGARQISAGGGGDAPRSS
jgi:hypothetical protein